MSDSVARYYELQEKGIVPGKTVNQISTGIIIETFRALEDIGDITNFLEKAIEISKKGPNLSPATVFQIAQQEVKVKQTCTPEK